MERQTTFFNSATMQSKWYHIDASDKVLGRLAVQLAVRLMGKHKPQWTPHIDSGDFIIVTNAEKIRLTGSKASQKFEKRYSGYPGGLKYRTYGELLNKRPERVIELAVRRMLPKSDLGRKMIKKLKVYAGPEHPHAAQQPEELELNLR